MFKFTIRDLLWLTLLAAVLVAWWMDRKQVQDTPYFPPGRAPSPLKFIDAAVLQETCR